MCKKTTTYDLNSTIHYHNQIQWVLAMNSKFMQIFEFDCFITAMEVILKKNHFIQAIIYTSENMENYVVKQNAILRWKKLSISSHRNWIVSLHYPRFHVLLSPNLCLWLNSVQTKHFCCFQHGLIGSYVEKLCFFVWFPFT